MKSLDRAQTELCKEHGWTNLDLSTRVLLAQVYKILVRKKGVDVLESDILGFKKVVLKLEPFGKAYYRIANESMSEYTDVQKHNIKKAILAVFVIEDKKIDRVELFLCTKEQFIAKCNEIIKNNSKPRYAAHYAPCCFNYFQEVIKPSLPSEEQIQENRLQELVEKIFGQSIACHKEKGAIYFPKTENCRGPIKLSFYRNVYTAEVDYHKFREIYSVEVYEDGLHSLLHRIVHKMKTVFDTDIPIFINTLHVLNEKKNALNLLKVEEKVK